MRFRTLIPGAMVCCVLVACSSGGDPECATDQDCPAGFYCRSDTCEYDCTSDRDCPSGWTCTARGRCEEGCKITNGGVEICDGVDNDCDDTTDEGLLNRCGECEPPDDQLFELCGDGVDNDCDTQTDEGFDLVGTACEHLGCHGVWVCSEDGLSEVCPVGPPAQSDPTCDGIDEDCDGLTDEDAAPRACPLDEGVCAGVEDACIPPGEWSGCIYGPTHTPDVDDTCDGLDNDCDGQTDEDAAFLLEPEIGAGASDGLDNNCNGLVDEAGGVLVPVPNRDNLWVDAYEVTVFENPGCTGTRYGQSADDYPPGWPADGVPSTTLYACSLPGLIPSGHLSWYRARWACEAQGKRLCGAEDWQNTCTGAEFSTFPYGSSFIRGLCNDAWQYNGEPLGEVAVTGAHPECTGGSGTFDVSGNLAEWLSIWDDEEPANAWTAGGSWYCELCDRPNHACYGCRAGEENDLDDIENAHDCRATGKSYESFPRDDTRHYLGARCCLDGP